MKGIWDTQRKYTIFTNLVDEIFYDLHDTDDMCFFVHCLGIIQDRFNYMISKYDDLDSASFEWVLRLTWFSVDFIMNETRKRIYEHPTFVDYLLVNDTRYGIKNKGHIHTKRHGW
jgi:hypothetical protein